ncbi:hypothetical protein pdam_00016964 [Pocillopora damicornis]|uniref:Ig-like domain-containing protein n=1 Tax=Pocillopora damicornis TaxID=46731 RepID=A0A3M6UTE2_POCDA|nr:hypothetical protein pdam_00016964 [Pocillopora damicornis]
MTLSSLILKAVLLGVLGALDSGRSTRACSVPDIRGKNGSEPRKVIKVNSGNNKRLPCWIKIIDPNQTLKYYWLKDNQTLSGGHQRTVRRSQFIIRYLRIRKAKKEDAGFYTCVVVSDCGESNHTIQLIVKEETKPQDFVSSYILMLMSEPICVNMIMVPGIQEHLLLS